MYSIAKANKFLPKIIDKNKLFEKEIKNKIRVLNIFHELDQKASKEFMNLIHLSETRNHNSKTGALLQTVLQKTNEKSNQLSSKIMNDPVFGDFQYLKDERKKLKKIISKHYEEEFIELLKRMEDSNKIENTMQTKKFANQTKHNQLDTFNQLSQEEILKRNHSIIDEKFQCERMEINKNIDEYLKKLNTLYNKFTNENAKCNDNEEKEEIKQRFNYDKKKLKGLTVHHKSDLLHYKKYSPKQPHINKSNSQKDVFNIKKLLPYTRMGKLKTGNTNIACEDHEVNLDALIHAKQSNDFSNTANLVLNQALRNYSLDEEFLTKAQSLNGLIEQNLPSIDEYNKIVKKKLTALKLNKNSNSIISKRISVKDQQALNDFVHNSNNDIKEDSYAAFNRMKTQKIKETIQNLIDEAKNGTNFDLVENSKIILPKENNSYLSCVNVRAKNKFCDAYSIREGLCNEMIDKLVEVLGNKSYSKKQISDSISIYCDLVNDQRKKQKENLHKKYLHQINTESKKLISDKIKRNLSAINFTKREEQEIDIIKNMDKKERRKKSSLNISSNDNISNNKEINDNTSIYYEEFLEQKDLIKQKEKTNN